MRMRLGTFETQTWHGTKEWDRQIWRAYGFMGNTTWFAIDTGAATRVGKMVNRADFDEGNVTGLMGQLKDDEAIFVAVEHSITQWWGRHPGGSEGGVYGGAFESCQLQIPLADIAAMSGYLITRDRVWIVNHAPPLGLTNYEEANGPAAVAALFADT